jgi:hypothetical protein
MGWPLDRPIAVAMPLDEPIQYCLPSPTIAAELSAPCVSANVTSRPRRSKAPIWRAR